MGWIKQKKNEHVCQKPDLDGLLRADRPPQSGLHLVKPYPGDIWQCDDCATQWKVHEHQLDGLYWLEEQITETIGCRPTGRATDC